MLASCILHVWTVYLKFTISVRTLSLYFSEAHIPFISERSIHETTKMLAVFCNYEEAAQVGNQH